MSGISEVDQITAADHAANWETPSEGVAGRPLRVDAWRRFKRNHMALFGLGMIVMLVLAAFCAPLITPADAFTDRGSWEQFRPAREGPSGDHWFGTDSTGRDVFTRVVYGARVSLRIGFFATAISLAIGVFVGMVSGYFGGWLDSVLMRFVDIVYAIPYMILAMAIALAVGRSQNSIILILGFTGWIGMSRVARSSFIGLRKLEYVEAAQALGLSRWRIISRHMLPNALQPIIVMGTIQIGTTIISEAALSFVGVGPRPPTPAWGLMVSEAGAGSLVSAPHMLLFPAGAIFVTVIAFVLVGDGLRDALDPKLK